MHKLAQRHVFRPQGLRRQRCEPATLRDGV
jgi:hypothetical protein